MIIVSAADESFVPHFATMLHSAWMHNPETEFYLLDCGIEDETLTRVTLFANQMGARLTTIPVKMDQFADLLNRTWPAAIYARLTIPDAISEDRVIYLDADCVVVGGLAELWTLDLGDCLFAGVEDNAWRTEQKRSDLLVRPYVNSGVMLMNLPAWRQQNFGTRVIEFVREHDLLFPDQTAINAVAGGRIKLVSDEWNFMLGKISSRQQLSPRVIHCTGVNKPWLYRDALFGSIYLAHRNATPFAMEPPTAFYRPLWRSAANMLFLRWKYWRVWLTGRHYQRTFIGPYLASMRG